MHNSNEKTGQLGGVRPSQVVEYDYISDTVIPLNRHQRRSLGLHVPQKQLRQQQQSGSSRTPFHAQAKALAAADIPVFPCVPNSKNPLIPGAYMAASVLQSQVDEWWTKWPDANVAIAPHGAGWSVVDLDPGGDEGWAELLGEHGQHEPTYTVETPRGGRHLYFSGALPSTVSKLAPHVDTRGRGGYVLVPPSIVNGKPYRLLHGRDIAPLPAWIAPRIETVSHDKVRGDGMRTGLDEDWVGSVELVTNHLKNLAKLGAVAVERAGGNAATYELAAECIGLGCSAETTERLLSEHWNPSCRPPWSEQELHQIVDHASQYMQEPQGHSHHIHVASRLCTAREAFGQTAAWRDLVAETESAEEQTDYDAFDEACGLGNGAKGKVDGDALRAFLSSETWAVRDVAIPEPLLGTLITRTTKTFLPGRTGLGKTMLLYGMAAGSASGAGFLNWESARPAKWLIIDGEMPAELIKSRIAEAVRRAGGTIPPGNLIVYARDLEDEFAQRFPALGPFYPLNTPAGHAFILKLVDAVGDVDVIAFDNVMSLISGDQTTENP